jgi:hypothetical protein
MLAKIGLIVAGLTILANAGGAQARGLADGARVRPIHGGEMGAWRTGRVLRSTVDSALVETFGQTQGSSEQRMFAKKTLEVYLGMKKHTVQGAVTGALVGAGIGSIIGYAIGKPCPYGSCSNARGRTIPIAAIITGIPGAAIGTFLGYWNRSARWEPVVPPGR